MCARLRYNIFRQALTDPELRDAAEAGLADSSNGLYIAPGCSAEVAEVAQARLGRAWLGCIH
jgi:hypothetical protein